MCNMQLSDMKAMLWVICILLLTRHMIYEVCVCECPIDSLHVMVKHSKSVCVCYLYYFIIKVSKGKMLVKERPFIDHH